MIMRRLAFVFALLALAACAPSVPQDRADTNLTALPPMKMFAGPKVTRPKRSNTSIANDFLNLSFMLESGRPLPVFTRFEGPVTIRVVGKTPPSMIPDLDRLITRLRREAGVDITRVPSGNDASITVETITRAELQRAVPQAACFVVPRGHWLERFQTQPPHPVDRLDNPAGARKDGDFHSIRRGPPRNP